MVILRHPNGRYGWLTRVRRDIMSRPRRSVSGGAARSAGEVEGLVEAERFALGVGAVEPLLAEGGAHRSDRSHGFVCLFQMSPGGGRSPARNACTPALLCRKEPMSWSPDRSVQAMASANSCPERTGSMRSMHSTYIMRVAEQDIVTQPPGALDRLLP